MKAKAAAAPRRGSGMLLLGLALGLLVMLATAMAVLDGVLLLPTLIVAGIDRGEGRPMLRAVLFFGLAASLAPTLALWTGGRSVEAALTMLSDISVPATAWAAQAVGWLLAELAPVAVRLALEAQTAARAAWFRKNRSDLETDWGIPAANGATAMAADVSAQDPPDPRRP